MKRLLPFLLILLSSAALAESGTYRIEVIIFRNLHVVTETTVTEDLRSFSHFPGLEEPRPPEDLLQDPVNDLPDGLSDELSGILHTDLPGDLHIIAKKSTRMNNVWRRLRSSSNYQPLVHAAWEQNRTDYYPPMRINDLQIIDSQLRPPTHIMVAELAAQDPLAAYRSTFFRLDGSVQLRRSRFLHLFLDLEYREEIPQTNTADMVDMVEDSTEYAVFALKQNRQIRTGRMQYFDTPYMGALVYVSAIPPK